MRSPPSTRRLIASGSLKISSWTPISRTNRGRYRSPAEVRESPRVERTISRAPSCFSSCEIRLVTTEGAAFNSRAAAVKLPSRATRMNALIVRRASITSPAALKTPQSLSARQRAYTDFPLYSRALPPLRTASCSEGDRTPWAHRHIDYTSFRARQVGNAFQRAPRYGFPAALRYPAQLGFLVREN